MNVELRGMWNKVLKTMKMSAGKSVDLWAKIWI